MWFCLLQDDKKEAIEWQYYKGAISFAPSLNSFGSELVFTCFVVKKDICSLWHDRLCHPRNTIVEKIAKHCNFNIDKTIYCQTCSINKIHKLPFQRREIYCNSSLFVPHMDVWDLAPMTSINVFKFYLIIVDEFSRFTWIYPLKRKDEVFDQFLIFQKLIENLLDRKILHSDWQLWGGFSLDKELFRGYLSLILLRKWRFPKENFDI